MSENKTNPNFGEAITEEQLTAVTGGGVSDPIHDVRCWFKAHGTPREDGRTKCETECKGLFDVFGKPVNVVNIEISARWFICRCWGSDNCVDKWHKSCGHDSRW